MSSVTAEKGAILSNQNCTDTPSYLLKSLNGTQQQQQKPQQQK